MDAPERISTDSTGLPIRPSLEGWLFSSLWGSVYSCYYLEGSNIYHLVYVDEELMSQKPIGKARDIREAREVATAYADTFWQSGATALHQKKWCAPKP